MSALLSFVLKEKILKNIYSIWTFFDQRAQRHFAILLMLNIGAAILEAASAGLIVPFIAIISNPDYIYTQPTLNRIYTALCASNPAQFQIFTALLLFMFFVGKNWYLGATTTFQYSFVYREMTRASVRMLTRYLSEPYDFHIQTNSSVLIRNVSNDVLMFFTNVVVPMLTVFAEGAVVIAMVILLFWLSPGPALMAIVVLLVVAIGFHLLVRRKVRSYGLLQQKAQSGRLKSISEALGGIKEIKLLGRENYFAEAFAAHERNFSETTRHAMVLSQMPRLFTETVTFSALFLSVVVMLLAGVTTTEFFPTMALFAVATVRLIPSANRILGSANRISYYWPSMKVVCADGGREAGDVSRKKKSADLVFSRDIVLRGISYTYPGASNPSLKDVNLTIPKGVSVALVGPSGAGKTTLADIILGLLKPSSGLVLVDGKNIRLALPIWQQLLGYIPQVIFLSDTSIRRNVAFGVPEDQIDNKKVWLALELAQLKDYVKVMPDGLDTVVGERGVSLSGGQRQRVGIARALYHNPEVLILDEATSALDAETEREISQSIDALAGHKTLIIITHRLSTIEKCPLKFYLHNGRVSS